ncbi:MAG: periplasmic heavy metal sensor [Rhodobacteraceae bacterium]|nr:periplasmic heavy metal sensor [Paracoccaceae bacterium]
MSEHGTGRRWTALLVVSLALNILVISAGIGLLIAWPKHDYRHVERFFGPSGLGSVARALDDHHKDSLRRELGSGGDRYRLLRRQGKEDLRQLIAVILADPFNPADLEAQFARQREAAGARLKGGHDLIAARITAMTREERIAFTERLEDQFLRSSGHGRK